LRSFYEYLLRATFSFRDVRGRPEMGGFSWPLRRFTPLAFKGVR
jgi:hypothetical protein